MLLCYSRMPYVRAYRRESQEMMFDVHNRAFAHFVHILIESEHSF